MTFANMAKMLKPATKGVAVLDHVEVSEHDAAFAAIRGGYVEPGKYARLTVDGRLMMTDTDMERRSNIGFAIHAHGDVLIAGLGLGMILTGIDRAKVRSVTVVEKYQDVIDLVGPRLPWVDTICADIMEWTPPRGRLWNTIYFDIWPDICTDNLDQMATLHRRFARRLNRADDKAWMGSWQKAHLQYLRSRGR